jgi:hypothetical protein
MFPTEHKDKVLYQISRNLLFVSHIRNNFSLKFLYVELHSNVYLHVVIKQKSTGRCV